MKKIKKIILISIISLLLISGIILGVYKVFKDKNSLTISEKTWISNNKNSVYTINVVNDINIFGKNGNGVFFDFINKLDVNNETELKNRLYECKKDSVKISQITGRVYEIVFTQN